MTDKDTQAAWDKYIAPYEAAEKVAREALLAIPQGVSFVRDSNGRIVFGADHYPKLQMDENAQKHDAAAMAHEATEAALAGAKAYSALGFSSRCAQKSLFTMLDKPRDAFIGKERKALTKAYLAQFGADVKAGKTRSLVFCGSVGTGKTMFSAAIAQGLCFSGISCKYILMPDLLEAIHKATSYKIKRSAHSVITEAFDKRFIVLDEVGRSITKGNEGALFEVFDVLWGAGKSFIITSNMTADEFMHTLDAACLDRILSSGDVVSFEGASYRQEAGK